MTVALDDGVFITMCYTYQDSYQFPSRNQTLLNILLKMNH